MAITVKNAKPVRPARGPGAEPKHIASITSTAFHGFAPISLVLASPASRGSGQWIVLLGDNGLGKTTLLRSIARTLSDQATNRKGSIGWRPPWSVNTDGDQLGVMFGLKVAPRSSGSPHPVLDDYAFDLFAYGSSRGTALGGPDRDVPLDESSDWETLFSPAHHLIHAETWLRREKLRAIDGGRFFEAVLSTVAPLLPGGEKLVMVGDQILVETPAGQRFPFAAMSDGYLTTLGWTIDLIARWAHLYRDSGKLDENFAKDMPCVVLVDELDLHLHPRWQIDIIPRLRAAFPKTTFVVTTHNPLTLQGTRPGEVFVLQKDAGTGNVSIVQRDVPPGTDANRLLTGDWFGLGSTLDESTLKLLDDHRAMLLTRRPESDPKRLELESQLRQRLGHFADTSYERIAQGVVAELLDARMRSRADITDADRQRVVKEVRARLAALDAVGAEEAGPTWDPGTGATKAPRTRAKAKPKAPAKTKRPRTRRKP